MKIGIVIDILKNRKTGVEYYTYNLINAILRFDKKNRYTLIQIEKSIHAEFEGNTARITPKSFLFNLFENCLPERKKWLATWVLRKMPSKYLFNEKINSLDVLFLPWPTLHFLGHKKNKIITVYDLTPLLLPAYHRIKIRFFFNFLLKYVLKRSNKLIAISNSTKKDLIRYMGIPEKKIKVVYPGLNPYITFTNNCKDAIKKYHLPKRYVLYFGTLEPRKNILNLIKAFALLKKAGFEEKLVLAGAKGWYYDNIFKTVKKLNLNDEVIFTGYIDESDVSKIYSAAKLFVYPSFYEGFGLPVIEAMACKCPVITSNVSSLPEAAGDAAILIDPYNINQIADAMKKVLSSPKLRKEMIRKGLIQASKFNWEDSAKKMIEIFEETK